MRGGPGGDGGGDGGRPGLGVSGGRLGKWSLQQPTHASGKGVTPSARKHSRDSVATCKQLRPSRMYSLHGMLVWSRK